MNDKKLQATWLHWNLQVNSTDNGVCLLQLSENFVQIYYSKSSFVYVTL